MVDVTQNKSTQKAPLEDLMAAMDVVDTLRHEQDVAKREFDNQGRRQRLLERLQDMYLAQGINVPESVLLEGIDALEQERFSYVPVPSSWKTKLAHIWVSRSRWGKPIGFLSVIATFLFGVYLTVEVFPERQAQKNIPIELTQTLNRIRDTAKNPEIIKQAESMVLNAQHALENNNFQEANESLSRLTSVRERLLQEYSIRVVSRANEHSGVWRIPPGNSRVRNYYLIVEAVDQYNKAVKINVVNEENNTSAIKKTWGLRVPEGVFNSVVADKQDDGIIQNNNVGVKRAGYLKPEFTIATTGSTITEW